MLAKYGSVANINNAWQTSFVVAGDIAMPDTQTLPSSFATSSFARRRWVDFIDWYHQAWVETLDVTTNIVAGHFPGKQLIASLGYGSEKPMFGNDQGRYVKAMAEIGLSCQSPGDIGYYPTRRVSSACRHYGVHYITEPPSAVPRDRELNRIFMDISNGVQTWFDYLDNLEPSQDYFDAYKKYLIGAPPRTTVAAWHPTADHWLDPELSWPEPIHTLSDQLRDVMAYEVIDDRMIIDGALSNLNVHQLILAGANWLDADAWADVHQWVSGGGVLIVLQGDPIAAVDGSTTLWQTQVSASIPQLTSVPADLTATWQQGGVAMGYGLILTLNVSSLSNEQVAYLSGKLCEEAGARVGHPEWNAKHIDGLVNDVLCTRFDDKLLYFNVTTADKQMNLTFRETDFPATGPRPANMVMTLDIPARTIVSVSLLTE